MNVLKCIALAFICVGMVSCVSMKNIQEKDFAMEEDEGIVIIGLPQGASTLFWMGDYVEGVFQADGSFPNGISIKTGERYLVQKTKASRPGRGYGLVSLNVGEDTFVVGCNQSLPILSVEAGKIQYYGDFVLDRDGANLVLWQKSEIDKAQKYINETYPESAKQIVLGEYEAGKNRECVNIKNMRVIIYM